MVGGGQLGRMFCFAAQAMGYRVAVLDPDETSPAGTVADRHIRAAYDDEASLTELARLCAAVSTEFENVPAASLDFLAKTTFVSPAGRCVAVAQDRIAEKRFIASSGVTGGAARGDRIVGRAGRARRRRSSKRCCPAF